MVFGYALVLAVLLAACAALAPPPEPVDQRALAAIAQGAATKRAINVAAGKAHGEQRITDDQLDEVQTAAEALELAVNRCRAQLRAFLTSPAPDAGALEASLVQLETARAHLVAAADGLNLQWRPTNG
jgi:hypothetical protein